MIHAYNEDYLYDAMCNLGEMMDYATNDCFLDMDEYFDMFIASGVAEKFGVGMPKIIAGMSGTELVWEVFYISGIKAEFPKPQARYDRSPEYWCGWILAYYQWYTGLTFKIIRELISLREIRKLYPTLHEAAEEKFVDTVNRIARYKQLPTRLQTLRRMLGYSQKILAEKSGVNIRTIQQYETRAKNINKGSIENVSALARAFGCRVEDLMEYEYPETE